MFLGAGPGLIVEEGFHVHGAQSRGWQECPLGNLSRPPHASRNYWIASCSDHLKLPGLAIHLIREHSFFEGDVPYRVDPLHAVQVLGLKSGEDYTPPWRTEPAWQRRFGGYDELGSGDFFREARLALDSPEQTMELGYGAVLYQRGDTCVVASEDMVELNGPVVVDGVDLGWGDSGG